MGIRKPLEPGKRQALVNRAGRLRLYTAFHSGRIRFSRECGDYHAMKNNSFTGRSYREAEAYLEGYEEAVENIKKFDGECLDCGSKSLGLLV